MKTTGKPHHLQVCERINSSVDFHTKSYSYRHECRDCGKSRRYNNNFLGNRYVLVCDGVKITRRSKSEIEEVAVVVGSRSATETTIRRFKGKRGV